MMGGIRFARKQAHVFLCVYNKYMNNSQVSRNYLQNLWNSHEFCAYECVKLKSSCTVSYKLMQVHS